MEESLQSDGFVRVAATLQTPVLVRRRATGAQRDSGGMSTEGDGVETQRESGRLQARERGLREGLAP